MSLDWSLKNIKDSEKVCMMDDPNGEGQRITCVTEMLIFFTMYNGMNEITEKNHVEFYARTNMFERVYGPFLSKREKKTDKVIDSPITYEQVRQHIGLHTNAGSRTKREFNKAMWRKVMEDVNGEVREYAKACERQDDSARGGRQNTNTGARV